MATDNGAGLTELIMTAKHTNLAFLSTHSAELAQCVIRSSPSERRWILEACLRELPTEITKTQLIDELTRRFKRGEVLDEKDSSALSAEAQRLTEKAFELEDVDEPRAEYSRRVGAALNALAIAMKHPEISAHTLDNALYEFYEILTPTFIQNLVRGLP